VLVHDFLRHSAASTPDKVALICDNRRLTYQQIERLTNRVANGLLDAGVTRGDRVAIWLPNSVEAVLAIFGILKIGATFVVINATTKPDKLAYVLNNCEARALFAAGRCAATVARLMEAVPALGCGILCGQTCDEEAALDRRVREFDDLLAASADAPTCPVIDLDLACLIYTSGSTGDPKGVM
jgi:acyl-CoA synthetase (AMP-forming)/AMP-acid ligase II